MSVGGQVGLRVVAGCDLDCVFCGEARRRASVVPVPVAVVRAAIDRSAGGVCFGGGEPTLHPDLPALLHHARAAGRRVSLVTHGLRWSEAGFGESLRGRLDAIWVARHAANPGTVRSVLADPGPADRFAAAVAAIAATGPEDRRVLTVPTREAADQLPAILDQIRPLRPRLWAVVAPVPLRGARDADAGLTLDEVRARAAAWERVRVAAAEAGIRLVIEGFPDCALGAALADRTRATAAERAELDAALPERDLVVDVAFAEADGAPVAAERFGRERAEPCRACSRADRCAGWFSAVLDRHGTAGLRPFAAEGAGAGRRLRVFGVGIAKTGTTSLARTFAGFRVRHEHRFVESVARVTAWRAGELSDGALRDWLVARDAAEPLDVEVSTFHHHWAAFLPELFPDARFVVTLRSPADQQESWLGMMLREFSRYDGAPLPGWKTALGRLMIDDFDPGWFASRDALRDALPEVLDRGLGYWARAHGELLDGLPPDRVLYVPTAELSASLPALAAFVGVEPGQLQPAHVNRGVSRDLLSALAAEDLAARVERICGSVERRLAAARGAQVDPR